MKNKKFIYILILCTALLFLYACNDEAPPEEETVEDVTDIADVTEEVTTVENDGAEIDITGEVTEAENDDSEIPEETTAETEINNSSVPENGEPERSEFEDMSYSKPEQEQEQEPEPIPSVIGGDMTKIGYFNIETPKGEMPVYDENATTMLPGGGVITADNGTQFTVESGAVLFCDEINSPFKLSIYESLRIKSVYNDMIIESPNGITISIDGMEEAVSENEEKILNENSPWWIYFDENKNAVFEFVSNGVKCTSLDSIFPMYKDADNGTILFKKCTIELTDGTFIDAPLNTIVKISDGIFTITIGMGEASMIKPDGTVSVIPKGTVIDSNF